MDTRTTKVLSAIAIAGFMMGCTARKIESNVDVVKASSLTNATNHSVVYSLPATALRVEVTAVKTVKKVGPFYRYAQKYFNISNVVTEDSEEWTIRSVKVTPYGKPDPNKVFAILQKGPGVAQNISVNNLGVLCGINIQAPCLCPEPYPTVQMAGEPTLETVNFDAVPMLEKQLVTTSTATMADETAQYIYKIRKRRSRIFTSDYPNLPPDGQAYQTVKDEVATLEHDFMELFAGKIVQVEIVKSFEYIPARESVDNNVLFRFSSKKGFVDRMDLSGTPVYAEVKDLKARTLPDTPLAQPKKGNVPNGLFYNSPGLAKVRILDRNVPVFEQEFELAQFGQLMSLPVETMLQPNLKIEMSSVTGSILSISNK
ncbi:MAG: DUF4831 family protein [Breznakibacter sp.]